MWIPWNTHQPKPSEISVQSSLVASLQHGSLMQEADFWISTWWAHKLRWQTDIFNGPSWRAYVSQCLQSNASNTDRVYNNITSLTCKLHRRYMTPVIKICWNQSANTDFWYTPCHCKRGGAFFCFFQLLIIMYHCHEGGMSLSWALLVLYIEVIVSC